MKIQTQSIGNHLGIGNDEILNDGWVNMSRFSNNNNYGALATSFTLVAVGSSGLLAGSILYDQSSIEFSNNELTHLVHAYNRYENWYALKDSYFDLIDNSNESAVCLFHNKLIFMPRNIDALNDTNHNEVASNLLLSIIKLNEEISKSKNLLFLDSTMGINFSALDFEFLNTKLNELYPNSITENIYLY
jgi:hypothetical protein